MTETEVKELAINKVETSTEQVLHRAKNSIQNVISYINLLSRGTENRGLQQSQVKRLIRYLHGLAILQDLLSQDMIEGKDDRSFRIDRLFTAILEIISHQKKIVWHEIPAMLVASAKASNLLLLLIEIIDMIDLDTGQEITLKFSLLDSKRVAVSLSALLPDNHIQTDPKVAASKGDCNISIVQLLTQSDDSTSFEQIIRERQNSAKLEFELI